MTSLPSPIQERPSSPSNDFIIDEQGALLSSDHQQDLDNAAQSVGFDRPLPARIRWIYFVLGAAILLPWNAIITAMPYFLSRLSGSPLQATFSFYLSTTFTVSGFFCLAHATVTSRKSDYSRQIRRSLITLTVLASVFAISTFVSLPPALFFILVILNGICQSSAGAYLQSAVVALASLFGPQAMQPAMSGQAAVGVLVSLIQVLSAGVGIRTSNASEETDVYDEDASVARAALIFFGLSTLFLAFTIGAYAWLVTMPDYKAVVVPFEVKKGVIGVDEEREALVGGGLVNRMPDKKGRIIDVAKLNLEYNFAVAYVFIITLSVFPPITSSIHSVQPPSSSASIHPLLFTAIHFLMFNLGDLVGRYLPMVRRLQIWSSRQHVYMALSRTLFIPLFLLCNVQRRPSITTDTRVPVINSDILFFLIIFVFGVSNGYICSLIMMAAPSREHNPRLKHRPEDVDAAATIAQFCLVGGLAIGSFMSFGVRGALCACNPFMS